jgi:hypothetical protein
MATITGNTAGSLKKMWPPVKKKALEAHPSFAAFLGTDGNNIAAPKAAGGRKRKAAADSNVEDADPKSAEEQSDGTDKTDSKTDSKVETKKKAPAKGKGRPAKKSKKEVKDEEDSADGGDGLGQYTRRHKVEKWLNSTDGTSDNKPKDIEDEV